MAMVLAEFRARHPAPASLEDEIVGTDVAAISVEAARRAIFATPDGLRGLPDQQRQQFFFVHFFLNYALINFVMTIFTAPIFKIFVMIRHNKK